MGSNDILGTYGRRPKKVKTHADSITEARRAHAGVERKRSAAVSDCYDSLGDFLASGQFRGLFVRPGVGSGATWTLKAVLHLPEGDAPVYMHGAVKHHDEIPSVVDYCLQRGDWREDKYYRE